MREVLVELTLKDVAGQAWVDHAHKVDAGIWALRETTSGSADRGSRQRVVSAGPDILGSGATPLVAKVASHFAERKGASAGGCTIPVVILAPTAGMSVECGSFTLMEV